MLEKINRKHYGKELFFPVLHASMSDYHVYRVVFKYFYARFEWVSTFSRAYDTMISLACHAYIIKQFFTVMHRTHPLAPHTSWLLKFPLNMANFRPQVSPI